MTQLKIYDGDFFEKKTDSNFCKKAPSQVFERVINMPQNVQDVLPL